MPCSPTLYAGSGAVGIEAISRGASLVYFVDSTPTAVAAIRTNLAALKITSGFQIVSSTVSVALRRLAERSPQERCSIVFLDPPYAADNDYAGTLSGIGHSPDSLLTPDGIVIAEHSRKMLQPLGGCSGSLNRYRILEQGDAGLSFYTR